MKPSFSYLKCPKSDCQEHINISPENTFENIKKPELFLLICPKCKTEYQLFLTEFKRGEK